MTTKKLERSQWQPYFDGVAKRIPSMRVAVSILGEDLGNQREAAGAELIGISYDDDAGVLSVDTPNVSHRVERPAEIYVREEAGTLSAVEVVCSDGTKEIIELNPLPALPAS